MTKKDRIFFDTNIFVYQFDKTEQVKQRQAIEIIERYGFNGQAVISTQVVQEFMNVALKKFAVKLSPNELEQVMNDLLKPLCAHAPTFDFYERTLRIHASNSISFYDALVVQAALDLECNKLYSEDLQNGQQFGGLIVINPFI